MWQLGGGDTAHFNLRHLVRCSNKDILEEGGTPHILIEGTWLDIQTWVGTPHKIQSKNLAVCVGERVK